MNKIAGVSWVRFLLEAGLGWCIGLFGLIVLLIVKFTGIVKGISWWDAGLVAVGYISRGVFRSVRRG